MRFIPALLALLLLARPAGAADLKEVIFASGDPSVSVATAPYTSLQQALGLPQKFAGVTVKVQPTAGATAASQAVASGNAFYAFGGLASLIVAGQKDPNLVVFSYGEGQSFRIVVPAASPIKSMAELKGKVIGTQSLGAAAYLFGRALVKQAGLDPDRDVKFLAVGVGAQAANALKSGAIAAYSGYDNPDAIISILLREKLRELASPLNDLVGGSGLLVRRDNLVKYPEVAAGLCKAFYTALLFAAANPEAAVQTHWRAYPDQRPSNTAPEQALADGVTILTTRLDTLAKPGANGLYGYQTVEAMQQTADTLRGAGLVAERADMASISDQRFRDSCGKLDVAAITAEAKAFKP